MTWRFPHRLPRLCITPQPLAESAARAGRLQRAQGYRQAVAGDFQRHIARPRSVRRVRRNPVVAQQVKQKLPDTVAIFILPPSRETLRQRLTDRATDNDSIIERRMREADREMSHYSDAEYLVINDDFEQALFDLECIIHSQSLQLERQKLKNLDLIASIVQETV